jgi:hypothetical protein
MSDDWPQESELRAMPLDQRLMYASRAALVEDKEAIDLARDRIAELESILRDILAADERGQGLPFAEAMERAHKALQPK